MDTTTSTSQVPPPMDLKSLGYVGIQAKTLDDWRAFGPELLGLQLLERTQSKLAFRMDDRKQRIVVASGEHDGAEFFGWEVEDAGAMLRLAGRLSGVGIPVSYGSAALAAERYVRELITFTDPAGNRIEVFHSPFSDEAPFHPGRSISGFRTGALGLGHLVLSVEKIGDVLPFYTDLLGFRLSDFALRPFKAYFLHINSRHHSLALIETGRNGVHHLMMETFSLDDVGQAYDLAQSRDGLIGATLGRHSNDFMTSFYAHTPAGFMVEYGWGGRDIDVETWRPFELEHGPSLWGHDRTWLGPEKREEARQMRLHAAREGHRQPVQVMPGHHAVLRSSGSGLTDAGL